MGVLLTLSCLATAASLLGYMLAIGEPTVRDYQSQFLFKGMASLVYQFPSGRPSKPNLIQLGRDCQIFNYARMNILT